MVTRKQHCDKEQKRKALSMLKEVEDRIKKGEWLVDTFGWWQGTPGVYTFKISAKEKQVSDTSE
jgi:hypothetical protein